MYNIYDIEMELNNHSLYSAPQLDGSKVETIIRIFMDEIKNLQTLNPIVETLQLELNTLKSEHKELTNIVKNISHDYPEIMIKYPQFFTKKESICK